MELLLALLVFSLGALAVASMQLGAVQAARSASESAAALLLAEDLAQRLLADADAIDRYAQSLDGTMAVADGVTASCLDGVACEPEAWAERGIAAWRALSAQRGLALPRACVSREATVLRVGINWASRSPYTALDADQTFCRTDTDIDGRRAVTLTTPLAITPPAMAP
ncbi:MAG: hypothetical protein ABR612_08550 [Chromatocurvus sp.]